jgi:hypothetical protein
MFRKNVSCDAGKEANGERAVGDPSFKSGFLRIGLVEMGGIKIICCPSEIINYPFCNKVFTI